METGVSGVDEAKNQEAHFHLVWKVGARELQTGDRIHSQWYGRGSSLFQLNLLRENLTTAELRCARIVEGLLFRLYLYSNTLACPEGKCHLVFTFLTGCSAYMEENQQLSAARLAHGRWCQGLLAPRSSLPLLLGMAGCITAVLLLLTSACWHGHTNRGCTDVSA